MGMKIAATVIIFLLWVIMMVLIHSPSHASETRAEAEVTYTLGAEKPWDGYIRIINPDDVAEGYVHFHLFGIDKKPIHFGLKADTVEGIEVDISSEGAKLLSNGKSFDLVE